MYGKTVLLNLVRRFLSLPRTRILGRECCAMVSGWTSRARRGSMAARDVGFLRHEVQVGNGVVVVLHT